MDFVNKVIEFCDKEKNVENLEKNGLLPDIIKILAKSDKNYIKDNIDCVKKFIEFCDRDEVLGTLIDEKCGQHIESLIKTFENSNIDNSNEITEELKSIKENYNLIQSISSLKEGKKVYETFREEANSNNKILSPQKNNDTEALDETVSFFENQKNKNKFIELAQGHTCGIMKLDTVIDNNGMIYGFKKSPNEAFLLPKGEINDNKESKDTKNYNVNLNKIEKQSKMDINRNAYFLNEEEIQSGEGSIYDNLENKIKGKFSKDAEKIIKKILSFPGQSSWNSFFFVQTFFNKNLNKQDEFPTIFLKQQNIQCKIETTKDGVYLYTFCKFTIGNSSTESFEPICIKESKKYRLNDQEEGKYTVPTLLAEHIAVFEAKPYVTENEDLAYLEIGKKKSEFNWINPKPEELVTFDVVNNAVNNEKK